MPSIHEDTHAAKGDGAAGLRHQIVGFFWHGVQTDQQQLPLVRNGPVPRVGDGDTPKRLAHRHVSLVVHRVLHGEGLVELRPAVHINAHARRDVGDRRRRRHRPRLRIIAAVKPCLLRLEHGIISVHAQNARDAVGLARGEEKHTLRNPLTYLLAQPQPHIDLNFCLPRDIPLRIDLKVDLPRTAVADAKSGIQPSIDHERIAHDLIFAILYPCDLEFCFHGVCRIGKHLPPEITYCMHCVTSG